MSEEIWSKIHSDYKEQYWIDKPSIFAEEAIKYFPESGKILDLGAGQGQDSRFFAERGYQVISVDNSDSALELNKIKITNELKDKITVQKLDISSNFLFSDQSFEIVYSHLSLHYFNEDTTKMILNEIRRILKSGGILAFLVNSTSDPQYKTGVEIEKDFFEINGMAKRFFSIESTKGFASAFETMVLDDSGRPTKTVLRASTT